MNILILLGIAAGALFGIWIVQSAALWYVGEPLAWPLRFKTRHSLVKWTSRISIHVSWLVIIVGMPLALRIDPLDALHRAFPTPVPWRDIALAFSLMFFPTWLMYGLYIFMGWVRIEPQHDPAVRRGKLFRRILGPWPLALLEEAVFRGVLLEQLLLSFPASNVYTGLAIVVSSAAFSAVHFIKPHHAGRPVWQPAYGLFIVGCLLGIAYVVGGRSLWLPVAIHGAAVFAVEVIRLYIVHQAPPWLLGYSEFPQSGLFGTMLISSLAIALLVLF